MAGVPLRIPVARVDPLAVDRRGARLPDGNAGPPARRSTGSSRRWSVLLGTLVILSLSLAVASVQAGNDDDRRVRTGARLFRALLAADVGLERKLDAEGRLGIAVYGTESKASIEAAHLIAPADAPDGGQIRGLSLVLSRYDSLVQIESARPIAVFLASAPAGPELDRLIRWSIDRRVILYSPFEGHVERGVLAGLSIEAKVQPYLNLTTLEASQVELKPFFVQVAKVRR